MKAHKAWFGVIAVIGAVVLTGCGPSRVTKYDVAKKQADQRDYPAAVETYKEFIAQNPDSSLVPYAMYNIGCLYRDMNDKAAAMEAFKKLTEQFPTKDPARWAETDMREMQQP